ncbi:MAG TPA: RluA family pseudouridine synthase [Phycisphaerae bacterium]|nr:RluA family pseudouridine synthase [Phycisphaerae bacterium]HRY69431.1 RluA family pseudouridine synthase [Phycisphaerae bacterium]HSA26298.1 RluA family pseudouridine synthase [Phycisphaerae bacterium]
MPHKHPKDPVPTILHIDDHLLVIDKPAGIVSVPGREKENCLPALLRSSRLVPPHEPFHTVHRLDRDASGTIVFARTPQAQRALTEQFMNRTIDKVYLALVQGHVMADGEVNLPILTDPSGTRAEVTTVGGKPSRTLYRVIERVAGNTLLECRPLTGRMHQIRVHMAAIGHPLSVDPLYGHTTGLMLSSLKTDYHPSTRHEERPLIGRLSLHAARVTFIHPANGEPVTFEAPLPKDFRTTLNQLRRL